jgi:hypothetical protein
MIARRLTLTTLAWLCALVALIVLSVPLAEAEGIHEELFQLSAIPAEGPLHEPIALPGPLNGLTTMTVDSGHLWIAEQLLGKSRLDKFNADTGEFISQPLTTSSEGPSGSSYYGFAVAHATGDLYVSEYDYEREGPVIRVYHESGGPPLGKAWTGAGAPEPFVLGEPINSVAVDNSGSLDWAAGDVYVAVHAKSQKVVDVFHPEADGEEHYVTQLKGTGPAPGEEFSEPTQVTVNDFNGDVIVDDNGKLDVFEPTSLGEYAFVRSLSINGIGLDAEKIDANDGRGDIYAAGETTENGNLVYRAFEFSATGEYLGPVATKTGTYGGTPPASVAADPETHDVFIGTTAFGPKIVIPDVLTDPASIVTPTSATLNGTVNPDEAGGATCRFVWGTSTEFGQVAPCEPEAVADGNSPVAVHAALSKLAPDTTYHYRLQASDANGTNRGEPYQDGEFTTPGPGIHDESATQVTATSATLHATINPNNVPATYYFQLGTSVAYGTDVQPPPGLAIGSGDEDVEVNPAHLQQLQASTVYHYRVVVVSEPEPGVSVVYDAPDQTFTTQSATSFLLPDGRQWELVSSPEKYGALLKPTESLSVGGLQQASVDGGGISYLASTPTEVEPPGSTGYEQVLSTRGADGWASRDIGLPHEAGGPDTTGGEEYHAFSEDLSLAVVHPYYGFIEQLSPAASEQTAYLRTDFQNGNPSDLCESSCFRPLVTGCPAAGTTCRPAVQEAANVPPGTNIANEGPRAENSKCQSVCGPVFAEATPDLSHIVFTSFLPLSSEAIGNPFETTWLYEWTGGQLTFIGVGLLGDDSGAARHAISDDGSRVIFENDGGFYGVKMRATTGAKSVLEIAPDYAHFEIASSDDSKVFYTDSAGGDLHECEVAESAPGVLQCSRRIDLTPNGRVSTVLGASKDGSYVYFVADGSLAPGAVPGNCANIAAPEPKVCNLYVYHDGETKLIGVLSGADELDWKTGAEGEDRSLARVSPDGEWLTFMSQQNLTGYDTRDAITGTPDQEVYLYNARSGQLVCVSCDPSGARPVGKVEKADAGEASIAARVPPWTDTGGGEFTGGDVARHQPRYMTADGRVFFDSNDALVPQDVNGAEDVYEYEPAGVGTCTTSSVTYSERSLGCIDLISSGTSSAESVFLDASESGGDVFFLTNANLASQDFDTAPDIYDAHECTSVSPCPPTPAAVPPACDNGDACKPSPTPQPTIFGAPASSTFSGAGNVAPSQAGTVKPKELTRAQKLAAALKVCKRAKSKKKRASCELAARKRYGATGGRRRNRVQSRKGVK